MRITTLPQSCRTSAAPGAFAQRQLQNLETKGKTPRTSSISYRSFLSARFRWNTLRWQILINGFIVQWVHLLLISTRLITVKGIKITDPECTYKITVNPIFKKDYSQRVSLFLQFSHWNFTSLPAILKHHSAKRYIQPVCSTSYSIHLLIWFCVVILFVVPRGILVASEPFPNNNRS